ncbi:hypothetical protein INS90_03105 [Trueperella pecoris]|uniref:Uncharacterized protein n=1 Tax=Trueperella pecoris TaxID=2733571 RepID=A0A7M1R3M1_9ACTO|nr:hypothetical protein [Trueperella pecoris]QOR48284.1 hypothetical protein INS90_03105 [Trueperella pecoris]
MGSLFSLEFLVVGALRVGQLFLEPGDIILGCREDVASTQVRPGRIGQLSLRAIESLASLLDLGMRRRGCCLGLLESSLGRFNLSVLLLDGDRRLLATRLRRRVGYSPPRFQ